MRTYKRWNIKGGCYFFTVVLAQRHGNNLLIQYVDNLRAAFKQVQQNHPFVMDAVVIMPDHLHCIWHLPEGDADFSSRWRLIKSYFSRSIPSEENISKSRQKKKERGIWQRRFWEHAIRDDHDYARHVEYIHYNPVKHGYVSRVKEWQYSSFHQWVTRGIYPDDWAASDLPVIDADYE